MSCFFLLVPLVRFVRPEQINSLLFLLMNFKMPSTRGVLRGHFGAFCVRAQPFDEEALRSCSGAPGQKGVLPSHSKKRPLLIAVPVDVHH